ncbi:meiotically up-regulated gene protein [Trichophyton mentagrophytes]|nr:meiotically up-regulated gene protein [Trichophyton mentagrophytes]
MPPLIRRRPLLERIKAYLNPLDFLLWLSEELDSSDWEQWEKEWALPVGIALNVLFLVARANSQKSSRAHDDVFGDEGGVSYVAWLASFIVHALALLSISNALYAFCRTRPYRLFEVPIEKTPSTPSAKRVQVNSSPMSSTPLRFISDVLSASSAEKRAHPDARRDVWQLSVWDPHPISIRLFCLFSPGHILVYWLFLPTLSSDPRPSVTIVTTIFLALLLTAQMSTLSASYSQQAKDSALVHKEVLNEYDTKFVHPRTDPDVRDVATQFSQADHFIPHKDEKYNVVETYAPSTTQHTFKTRPNPNYIHHVDPDYRVKNRPHVTPRTSLSTPQVTSSGSIQRTTDIQTPSYTMDTFTPIKKRSGAIRQPQFRPPSGTGDGGSLGSQEIPKQPSQAFKRGG